jgi:hypothetical protein
MSDELYHQIGRLEAMVDALGKNVDKQSEELRYIRKCMLQMKSQLDQAKGGRAHLMALLGAAATLGAVISHGVSWVRG